jgi:hypothetical protein
VRSLPRIGSDHAALIVDFGLQRPVICKMFHFELCWLLRPDLREVVSKVWFANYVGRSSIDVWHNRMVKLRSTLKGRNLNWEGFNRKKKKLLIGKINNIDIVSENSGLSLDNYKLKKPWS